MKGYEELFETVKTVQATGMLKIDDQAVIDYQDMIGHSSEEQLEALANGMYKEAFYRVYGAAAGTVEAIRFHCKHGQKIKALFERIDELEAIIDDYRSANECLNKTVDDRNDRVKSLRDECEKAEKEKAEALETIKEQTDTIQELKAKLYDLITK